jgi:hypothetical protein
VKNGQGRKRLKPRAKAPAAPPAPGSPENAPAKPADGQTPPAEGTSPAAQITTPAAEPEKTEGKPKEKKGAPLVVFKSAEDFAGKLAHGQAFACGAAAAKYPRALPAALALGWFDPAKADPQARSFPPSERASEAAELMWPLMEDLGLDRVQLSREAAFFIGCAMLVGPAVPELFELVRDLVLNRPPKSEPEPAPQASQKSTAAEPAAEPTTSAAEPAPTQTEAHA